MSSSSSSMMEENKYRHANNSSWFEPSSDADKISLMNAIKQLTVVAADREYAAIADKTLNVALAFVQWLPTNRQLPKIAVDEDGCVLFMWRSANGFIRLGVTIEEETVRAVANPGHRSDHLDPIIFKGYVPPSILDHVPTR